MCLFEWEGEVIHVINVYSPCSLNRKRQLWDDLIHLKGRLGGGFFCQEGDFNAELSQAERRGLSEQNYQAEIIGFNGFIMDIEVVNTSVLGKKFTCFNRYGISMSRIDCILLSEDLMNRWKVPAQWSETRDISDHFPVWLVFPEKNWRPKPFRFLNCCLERESFMDEVISVWNNCQITGNAAYVAKEKLKQLKEHLRKWNMKVFGLIDLKIDNIVTELNVLDATISDDPVGRT